ncbi:zinc finger FYVE domain-containing protein 16-like protein [Leptotrombidium deliense]|uniref:Zinc finger FYVE domain-containing protein 16-like protein n=1 Tax=Leptotrombidium deliense TaxID=299467 RepID=A0A443SBH8_9ACAR|nr:zinc finger FYVE domain-containing protein 16-like protein [Leptotrombidium deliense]
MDKFMVDFDAVLDELEAQETTNDKPIVSMCDTQQKAALVDLNLEKTNIATFSSDLIEISDSDISCERPVTSVEQTCSYNEIKDIEISVNQSSDQIIDDAVCEVPKASVETVEENLCSGSVDECNLVSNEPELKTDNETLCSLDESVCEKSIGEEINNCIFDSKNQNAESYNEELENRDLNLTDEKCEENESALNSNTSEATVHVTRPSTLHLPNTFADNEFVANIDSNESPPETYYEDNVQNPVIDGDFVVGKYKPFWIPDTEASSCMSCDAKFTVIKRRHHCRACGKVLCSQCCNAKAKLAYLSNKEARVCGVCLSLLTSFSEECNSSSNAVESSQNCSVSANRNTFTNSPNPNNPSEYCSSIPPLEQAESSANRPPPTVFVPVGVLKRGNKPRGEPKQVVFSDGIRPGSDLSEPDPECVPNFPIKGRQLKRLKSPSVEKNSFLSGALKFRSKNQRITIIDSNGPLPAIINCAELTAESDPGTLFHVLHDEDVPPVTFYLTKNLHAVVKLVSLDCCMQNKSWIFASKGLSSVGQDEIVIALEMFPDESCVPRDVFRLFTSVYDYASRGSPFAEMSHILFTEGLFDNKENCGFIFMRPTFQCLKKFLLPSPPYLVGLLLHKCEIPWAKIFPIRLLLRLGAEYRYYPCPLISYRNRKPAYFEIGHTIMNVLADFRNFQYSLPCIPGLVIHTEDTKRKVNFARNRYDQVMKALSSSNEHVLAFAANFSTEADSHLTCIQNDDGQYQTQTIKSQDSLSLITGASFIVFSGALKSSTGLSAKMSIVEDGILVQIPPNTMSELKNALRAMQDFTIKCGKVDAPTEDSVIQVLWVKDDKNFNVGVKSSIDGMSLQGVHSVRIYNGTDYAGDKYFIRWTEVFFIQNDENSRRGDSVDPTRLAGIVAQSLCLALTPHLEHLVDNNFVQISLRVTLDPEKIGYDVGSNGSALPAAYVNELDGALIPVIMNSVAANVDSLLIMELLFHILVK